MDFNILQTIKNLESNHSLNILLLNDDQSFNIYDIINLAKFGNIIITVETPLQSSQLIAKVKGLNIKVILSKKIPNQSYDLVISNYPSELLSFVILNLIIKYVHICNMPKNLQIKKYQEFLKNTFKSISLTSEEQNIIQKQESNLNIIKDESKTSNKKIDYNIFINDIKIKQINYNKHQINYLNSVIPGKVSIIMIVSELNNNFADVIRDLKSQDYPLIEFIIIDNAAGFRNNVKPNIRYGQKMPIDFCEYHAKELCSGEYMIILHEDSESFIIKDKIEQKKYEVR